MQSAIDSGSYPSEKSSRFSFLSEIALPFLLRLVGERRATKAYRLRLCLRSSLGHFRTQLAKDGLSLHIGPTLERHQGGYRRNRRTAARNAGIETLRAIHPWV